MNSPESSYELTSGNRTLSLRRPRLMGVLNVTPDSFSDGGKYLNPDSALIHARGMITEGADWIDVGGESSGPDSKDVPAEEEWKRVAPVIIGIRRESDIWLSIDTWKAEVARRALQEGVDTVNDVTALRGDPDMASVLAGYHASVVLMYSKDSSARTTRKCVKYADVMISHRKFFSERLHVAESRGIHRDRILLDPGMGFFVSGESAYSFEIVRRLNELKDFGLPLVLGPSRKSFLATVTSGKELGIKERDAACAAVSSVAVLNGIRVLRMHDVRQGRQLLDTLSILSEKAV